MFKIPKNIDEKIYQNTGVLRGFTFFYSPYRAKLLSFYQEFSPFFSTTKSEFSDLPEYRFQFSEADINHFKKASDQSVALLYRAESADDWRSGLMKYNNTEYKIKAKLHGNSALNFIDDRLALNIKIDESNYINGQRNFQFLFPEEAGMVANLFANDLAFDLGLHPLKVNFIKVYINNRFQGIYLLSEKIDDKYLERNGLTDRIVLAVDNVAWEDIGNDIQKGISGVLSAHLHPFVYETTMIEQIKSPFGPEALFKYDQMLKSLDDNTFIDYIDVDAWSSYEAWRVIRGDLHESLGDNLRFAYSISKGIFYPIPRVESPIQKLTQYHDVSFEHELNSYSNKWVYSPFINALSTNDLIRNERNKKLYAMVLDSKNLLNQYSNLQKEYYKPLTHNTGKTTSREISWLMKNSFENFQNNILLIKNRLETSRVYIKVIESQNNLSFNIKPDSNSALQFDTCVINLKGVSNNDFGVFTIHYPSGDKDSFSIKLSDSLDLSSYLNKNLLQFTFDDEMKVVYRSFNYSLTIPKSVRLINISSTLTNTISNQSLSDSDIRIVVESAYSEISYASMKELENQGFTVLNNAVLIPEKTYVINETLILPPSMTVVIKAGAKLLLKEDVSLLVQNNLFVQGTKNKPVIILSENNNISFGSFALNNINKPCIANISYLDISGGNEAVINGKYFSGALSIHNCDINIINSKIHGNFADDGANFKHCRAIIKNTSFYNNYADQIDIDFCHVMILNSFFHKYGGDINGDGIDLSGSLAIIENNFFNGFSDKAISIGEKSIVTLNNNIIKNSTFGVAIKDLSKVFIINNTIDGGNYSLALYQKKEIFGGGTAFISDNVLESNSKHISDSKSNIFVISNFNNSILTFSGLTFALNNISYFSPKKINSENKFEYQKYSKSTFLISQQELSSKYISSILSNFGFNNVYHNDYNYTEMFFDSLNKKIINSDSSYSLQTISNKSIRLRKLVYFKPTDNNSYYELSKKISKEKTHLSAIEYAVDSKKNPILSFLHEDINLFEKLESSYEIKTTEVIYEFYSSICIKPVLIITQTPFIKDNEEYFLIKITATSDCSEKADVHEISEFIKSKLAVNILKTTPYSMLDRFTIFF